MAIQQSQYEELLATYTEHRGMLALLKRVRPYLEMLPSMRRPQQSLITIPLPIIKVRDAAPAGLSHTSPLLPGDAVQIPCDVALLMCDPDWKIKTGVEIFIFIHRPHEDFSTLLGRWRQTQLWINKGYDWVMPSRYRHMFGEGAEESYPLFVIFPETPDRVQRGLTGAELPFVIESVALSMPDQDNLGDADPEDRDGEGSDRHNSSLTNVDVDIDPDSSTSDSQPSSPE